MSRHAVRALFAAALALALPGLAASRARYGGTLKVAAVAPALEADPLLADTPAEAAVLAASASALCRLDPQGRALPLLAQELTWASPSQLRVLLRPGLRLSGGTPLLARDVAASLSRVLASPYRALLAPLKLQSGRLPAPASSSSLELSLSYPFPDLERALCAPALAAVVTRPGATPRPQGLGPFSSEASPLTLAAQPLYPQGRPFADKLTVTATDERGAKQLFALEQAQVVLGAPQITGAQPDAGGPALYATYLVLQPTRTSEALRQALASGVDRADLTHLFVRQPAVPMNGLLPPALLPQEPAPRPAPVPARRAAAGQVSVLYDAQNPDHREVAERLQLMLHDRGYVLHRLPLPRAQLRARLAARDFDLVLHSVLLPPVPSLALALALDAAGRPELLGPELSAIGALPDPAARDARARERANALAPSLSLVPLYAQGLSVQSAQPVWGLIRDGQGLPSFADAFLGAGPEH